ncbi:MAG: cell division protein FtsA [Zoogloeaceae bacterium]|jgi:cell division protein FtsA|nr:cell division protein FtsA [Zoogloeaceae bacterium]
MSNGNRDLIVGLDIGTSKIVALVAEFTAEGHLNIIGVGDQASRGLNKGVVVNVEETVATINRVIEEVELMAGCQVREVYTGIAGSHIKSFDSKGMVAVKGKEVSTTDVERVMETARAMPIPDGQKILHNLCQEFVIDGQDGYREPIGITGTRLEVNVHIVTGAVSAAQNIMKCVRRAGLEVCDIVLQPLASSHAVLSEEEKDIGVCLLDIGGGTTDIAVWRRGAIRYTAVIPVAGSQVTRDIADYFRTSVKSAEDVKHRYGYALAALADPEASLEIPGADEDVDEDKSTARQLSRQALAEVIEARLEELYGLVQQELAQSGYEHRLSAGIVLTGGSAQMPGMIELGQEIFHMPVRLGVPKYKGSLADIVRTPRYATAYGLLLEAQQQRLRGQKVKETRSIKDIFSRMSSWFEKNF